jgi:hypothetical protein
VKKLFLSLSVAAWDADIASDGWLCDVNEEVFHHITPIYSLRVFFTSSISIHFSSFSPPQQNSHPAANFPQNSSRWGTFGNSIRQANFGVKKCFPPDNSQGWTIKCFSPNQVDTSFACSTSSYTQDLTSFPAEHRSKSFLEFINDTYSSMPNVLFPSDAFTASKYKPFHHMDAFHS